MDLIKELLDHGSQTLAAFKDNIPTLLAIIAISAIAASRWQRSRDDGEIRGVKAENNALKEQLNLARHDQKVVTKQSTKLGSEIAELRVEFGRMKASLRPTDNLVSPQLDKVASTTAVLSDTVRVLQRTSFGKPASSAAVIVSRWAAASKEAGTVTVIS